MTFESLETARGARDRAPSGKARYRVLVVPGFVVDTYSEIERSYVELSARRDPDVEYIWLVPDVRWPYNRFARPRSRYTLDEPVWVPPLRQHAIRYVVGNVSPYNVAGNYRLFRDLFRRYGIDAVYTHFGFERFWAAILAKRWGKRVIWNEHWHSLGTRYVISKRIFYRLFVDDFIAVSDFIARRLPAGGRVHTVANAIRVPGDLAAYAKARVPTGVGLGAGAVVLMVAAFRPEKRHDLALAVCAEVLRVAPDTRFIFLGAGDGRFAFLEQARRLGIGDQVQAPGHVDDVDAYYAMADVCILTSHNEPFGYVVLEAMSHGLPIVAFASGGPAEIIRDGRTGYLVADGDTATFAQRVLELLRDGSRRGALGEAARRAVRENYDREAWIGRINAIVKESVRTDGRAPAATARSAL